MKSKFPGYFRPTKKEIKNLWDNAIIALDANVLLNLYRYSDETKDELLKIFAKIKSRVWIPNQAAKEFFENKLNVIHQQEKAYDTAISSLNSIETEFRNSRQHPFISKKLLDRFSKLTKEICAELSNNKSSHSDRIVNDEILDRINTLFDDKVGDEYSEEKLEELFKIGEERFEKKIPPGFKDVNKNDSKDSPNRKYGDFIVWRQILDYAKKEESGVILVTDDRKEDWWTRFKGKTLQPRPELILEFITETQKNFHMYQSDRFLEYARDFLDEEIKQEAINEIRELRKLDEMRILRELKRQEELLIRQEKQQRKFKEQLILKEELNFIKEKRQLLELQLEQEQYKLEVEDPSIFNEEKLKRLMSQLERLNLQERELKERLSYFEEREFLEQRRRRRNKTLHNKGYDDNTG